MEPTLIEEVYKRGGGMINCGDHLGVFVAQPEDIQRTPLGWIFVDMSFSTLENLQQAVKWAKEGRKNWPSKNTTTSILSKQNKTKKKSHLIDCM